MGVVSGRVMAYQFGTHWSFNPQFAGSITGPLLSYEVLTAFFLEAGFLGVMLLGWHKVGRGLHFFATLMVTVGTMISATWILAFNSWMQTPQEHEGVIGVAIPVDWFAIISNSSFPYRLAHMVTAAILSTALFVGASGAWHLLKGYKTPAIKRMFSMALWMLLFAVPLQVLVGDVYGLNTLKHQPAKIAAVEGHWANVLGEGVPLILFGWPDMDAETTRFKVGVRRLAGFMLTHSLDGQIAGLKDFPCEDRPNATVLIWRLVLSVSVV